MFKLLKDLVCAMIKEFKNDLLFFPIVGFIIGLTLVCQFGLEKIGMAQGPFWADILFNDFVPCNSFLLFLLMLLLSSSIKTGLNLKKIEWKWMENLVSNTETRLIQLTSATVLFSMGLSIAALIYAKLSGTNGGVALFKALIKINSILFSGCFISLLAIRINNEYKIWWMAVTWGVFSILYFVSLLI